MKLIKPALPAIACSGQIRLERLSIMASARLVFLLGLIFCLGFPLEGHASEEELKSLIKELAQQVKKLNDRVADLERQIDEERSAKASIQPATSIAAIASASAPGQTSSRTKATTDIKPEAAPVTAGDFTGSFKIPGTDSSLGIGGYIKLDALYNSVSAGKDNLGDQTLVPASIPIGPQRLGEHGQITLHAKETRLWFKTLTPGKIWGDLSTYLELDFYGSAATSTYTPRIRHAFGSLGRLTAGQTWTTFTNVAAIPELLDINGPIGIDITRQPLIRWSQPFTFEDRPVSLQAALEAPKTNLIDGTYGRSYPDDDRYPDWVLKLGYDPSWGSLSLAGLARQLRVSSNTLHRSRQEWTGGFSLAGKVRAYDLDNIRFMLNYGNAIGRYASNGTFDDAVVLADPANPMHLDPVTVYSGYLAYQHWWRSNLRSTVALGFARADNPVDLAELNRQIHDVHVNLLWSPLLRTTIGLEYIYANREREDRASGSLHRLQFSTRFNF